MNIQTPLFTGDRLVFSPIDPEKDALVEAKWTQDAEYLRLLDTKPALPLSVAQVKKRYEKIEKDAEESKNMFYFALRAKPAEKEDAERLIGFPVVELGLDEKAAIAEANRCLRCDLRLDLASLPLPPAHWLEFTAEQVAQVPEAEGVFELLDEEKNVLMICGTPNLRQSLTEKLQENSQARYFTFEEEPMYTQRESELLQQYLQQHGQMPGGGASDLDDLF